MDTPLNPIKAPRRKLKRVLKKRVSAVPGHSSSHHLYQKKIRNAINTSLNLSSNVRTLQSNNRSLAVHNDKLRRELRLAMDAHTCLLRHNHNLSERISELERQLDMTPSIIEYEVDSRCKAKLQEVQSQFDLLITSAFKSFTKVLNDMKEQCITSPRNSRSTGAVHSLRLSTCSSQGTALPSFSPDPTLAARCLPIDNNDEMCNGFDTSPRPLDKGDMNEMSVLMESSHLGDHLSSSPTSLLRVSEDPEQNYDIPPLVSSRQPSRKLISKGEAGDLDSFKMDVSKIDALPSSVTRRSSRRNTYLISETRSPTIHVQENPESVLEPCASHESKINQDLSDDFTKTIKDIMYAIGCSPLERSNLKQNSEKICVKKTRKKTAADEVLKSPSLYIRNAFELHNAHKEWLEKADTVSAKKNDNEIAACVLQSPESESASAERTTYAVTDMEFTLGVFDDTQATTLHSSLLPSSLTGPTVDSCQTTLSKELQQTSLPVSPKISSLAKLLNSSQGEQTNACTNAEKDVPVRSRSRHRQHSPTGNDVNAPDSEHQPEGTSVPDAVTMRVSKGGKLVFAAGRKGADGSRSNVSSVVQARSKSKRFKKSEQSEQSIASLVKEKAETIFDFHDKTPKSLQQNHQSSMSVFSLSADESINSPLGPLNKYREVSKARSREKSTIEISKGNPVTIDKVSSQASPAERSRCRSKNASHSRGRSRGKRLEEDRADNFSEIENYSGPGETEEPSKESPLAVHKISSQALSTARSPGRNKNVSRSRSRSRREHFEEENRAYNLSEGEDHVKCIDVDHPSTFKPSPTRNSASVPAFPEVGEIYCEPLKDSPEVKKRYRTRSQSRGRRGRSSGRQSPESVKKVRSKSASSHSSPTSSARKKSFKFRDCSMENHIDSKTSSSVQRSSEVYEKGNGYNQHPISGEEKSSMKGNDLEKCKLTSTRSPEKVGRIRKSRPNVRNAEGRSHSPSDSVNNVSKSFAGDVAGHVEGGAKDFTELNNLMNVERHRISLESSNKNRLNTKSGEVEENLLAGGTFEENQLFAHKSDGEDRKSRISVKGDRVRSRSPAVILKKVGQSQVPARSPAEKFAKSIPEKLPTSPANELKRSGKFAKEQVAPSHPSLDRNPHIAGDEEDLEKDTNIRRRLAHSRGMSINKTRAKDALSTASPPSRLTSTCDGNLHEQEQEKEMTGRSPPQETVEHIKTNSQSFDRERNYAQCDGLGADELAVHTSQGNTEISNAGTAGQMTRLHSAQNDNANDNTPYNVDDKYSNDHDTAPTNSLSEGKSQGRQKKMLKNASKKKYTLSSEYKKQDSPGKKQSLQTKLTSPTTGDKHDSDCCPNVEASCNAENDGVAKTSDHKTLEDGVASSSTALQHNVVGDPEALVESGQSRCEAKGVQGEISAAKNISPSNKIPKISKIVKNSSALFNFSTDPESLSSHLHSEGRKRRAAANVSYVAPPLNSKLRRGDPFTSHYATEKISIYKSPKSRAKEKARMRRDILGSLHNMAINEHPGPADVEQE